MQAALAAGRSSPAAARRRAQCGPEPATSASAPFTVTRSRRFRRALGDGLPAGQRRADDRRGAGHRKGRPAVAGRCASGNRQQAVSGVPAVKVAGPGRPWRRRRCTPDFAGNQRVYLTYAEAGPNGTSGAALGYGRLVLGQGAPRLEGFKVDLAAAAEGRPATAISPTASPSRRRDDLPVVGRPAEIDSGAGR